jgi:hypothetical protein
MPNVRRSLRNARLISGQKGWSRRIPLGIVYNAVRTMTSGYSPCMNSTAPRLSRALAHAGSAPRQSGLPKALHLRWLLRRHCPFFSLLRGSIGTASAQYRLTDQLYSCFLDCGWWPTRRRLRLWPLGIEHRPANLSRCPIISSFDPCVSGVFGPLYSGRGAPCGETWTRSIPLERSRTAPTV